MGGVMQPVAPGLTGRSTRTRSGIAPQGVLVSVRLAAQCHCMLVNSDVRLLFLAPSTRRIPICQRLSPVTRRRGAVAVRPFARSRRSLASRLFCAMRAPTRPRAKIQTQASAQAVQNSAPCSLTISAMRRVGNNLTRRSSGRAFGTPLS